MSLEELTIQLSDVEDTRQVLAACLNLVSARDFEQAQIEFRAVRPSPLTVEIERVKARLDHYLSDFLLARHEAALEEDDAEVEEDLEEAENGSEGLSEASEEELSPAPLGEFKPPRQKGRRLNPDEV